MAHKLKIIDNKSIKTEREMIKITKKKREEIMKENKLRYHLEHDRRCCPLDYGVHSHFSGKTIGATGTFDYVEFVAEYAPYDFTDLPNMARAAELNDMAQ